MHALECTYNITNVINNYLHFNNHTLHALYIIYYCKITTKFAIDCNNIVLQYNLILLVGVNRTLNC